MVTQSKVPIKYIIATFTDNRLTTLRGTILSIDKQKTWGEKMKKRIRKLSAILTVMSALSAWHANAADLVNENFSSVTSDQALTSTAVSINGINYSYSGPADSDDGATLFYDTTNVVSWGGNNSVLPASPVAVPCVGLKCGSVSPNSSDLRAPTGYAYVEMAFSEAKGVDTVSFDMDPLKNANIQLTVHYTTDGTNWLMTAGTDAFATDDSAVVTHSNDGPISHSFELKKFNVKAVRIGIWKVSSYDISAAVDNIVITETVATSSVAENDAYTIANDTTLTVVDGGTPDDLLANDTIIPPTDKAKTGDVVTAEGITVTIGEDGSFSYTPTGFVAYEDSFEYEIVDGNGDSLDPAVTATATITVTDPTLPVDDTFDGVGGGSTPAGITCDVLANDTNDNALSPAKKTDPANGTVVLEVDNTFTYTPSAGFYGTDSFEYTLGTDGEFATVTINVTDGVIVTPDIFKTAFNTTLTTVSGSDISVLDNDTQIDSEAVVAATGTTTGGGSFDIDEFGYFTYSPATDFGGRDTFTYTLEGSLATAPRTATVAIIVPKPIAEDFATASPTALSETATSINGTDYTASTGLASVITPSQSGFISNNAISLTANELTGSSNKTVRLDQSYIQLDLAQPITLGSVTLNAQRLGNNITGYSYISIIYKLDGADWFMLNGDIVDGATVDTGALQFTKIDGNNENVKTVTKSGLEIEGVTSIRIINQIQSGNTVVTKIIDNITITEVESTVENDSYNAVYYTPLTVAAPGALQNDNLLTTHKIKAETLVGDQGGSLVLATDGGFVYTQSPLTHEGQEVFTYQIVDSDDAPLSPALTATITINTASKVDNTLMADNFSTAKNTDLTTENVLDNDTITLPDTLDPITAGVTTEGGSITLLADGSFTYSPATDFTGLDTFDYTVNSVNTTVSIIVYDPAGEKTSLGGLITQPENWSDGALSTYAELGIIGNGAKATFPSATDFDINEMNLRIDTGGTLKPATNPVGYDINSSLIHINGGTYNTTDVAADNLRLRETTQDTVITIDSGSFESSFIQLITSTEIKMNGGTFILAKSGTGTFKFDDGTVDYGEFLTLSGGSVELEAEIDFSLLTTGSAFINFTDKSEATIDIAAHTDELTAFTYWSALWDADQLKYNGQSKSDLSVTRAPQDFDNFFIINETTFALQVDPALTPVLGLEVTQSGSTLTWSATQEIDVKQYQIVNAITGKLIDIVVAGELSYTYELEDGVLAKLVVVDKSGSTQTFYPENGNVQLTTYDLVEGWNLIAITSENADITPLTKVSPSGVWSWDGSVYTIADAPQATDAIWVHVNQAKQVTVAGDKSDQKINITQGWNLIGPTENCQIPASAVTVYSWNAIYEQMLNDDILLEGVGYWILSF